MWTVATTKDTSLPLEAQIKETLQIIDDNLQELQSNKHQIVSAQVYLANITDKPVMDEIWKSWIGDNPDHWPQRACLGVDLEGNVLIEVSVTAVVGQ
ncbi:Rid family hydrolase [Flammeovirga aprica]|uniref:Rid family hydrolase n=1 Tax=Flammeovirga aprica TaxID=29528 RepID=UPI00293C0571|nr:Rid family hydrolase [Flammeovirga aprica]